MHAWVYFAQGIFSVVVYVVLPYRVSDQDCGWFSKIGVIVTEKSKFHIGDGIKQIYGQMVLVYFLTLSGIVQTSPVAACSSCGAVLGSACTTSGVVLSRIWAASDDGKIVVGSLYTVGGSLQQSNYYMSQIILMMFCGFYGNHAHVKLQWNSVH